MSDTARFWIAIGFLGQFFFFCRFLVQWIVSERMKRSVMPDVFWYLSVLGGVILLVYATYRRDPVFIIGQAVGLLVYSRNIWLIHRAGKEKGF